MTIYIVYFFLILLVPALTSVCIKDQRRAQLTALNILMFLMYLILALKGNTVGNDIEGYRDIYEYTASTEFSDFSYTYMENGYLLLMKVGNIIGVSFQFFTAILYVIILVPLYILIKKYSSDVMLSMMILFCLDFFVFACSGLRQAVGMSLCVAAFLLLKKNDNIKYFILSCVIVVGAAFFHKSALLFLPILLIIKFRMKTITYFSYIVVFAILIYIPQYFININVEHELSKYHYDDRLTIGLMFAFDVIMFVFFLFSQSQKRVDDITKNLNWDLSNILFYGLILAVAFNGSIIMRSSLFELLFLSVIMPRAINSWELHTRQFIKYVYISVLFYCLYFLILKPATLNIVPYKFFFE